ncbi:MAG: sialate O-acetylesterase [Thermoguttaceae bacterium]|jgi:sialate O-acetylesterase|nr:sialate O-acetylesterase [Thermoguttaceae bacterium]
MNRRCLLILLAALALRAVIGSPAAADVKLPGVFSPHMVLQRELPVPVWGWADAGEKVTVALAGQTREATADADGRWSVRFDPITEPGPYTLKVEGKNTIEVPDVLAGEVWLGSGQSNMAMTVNRCLDVEQETASANHPRIRMFTVARTPAETPQSDVEGSWQVCSPETVGGFSATAYFFGRELHQELDVPVGLINSSWGGTPVQAWTSVERQQEQAELKTLLDDWSRQISEWNPDKAEERFQRALKAWEEKVAQLKADGKTDLPRRPPGVVDPKLSPHRPGTLFNGMIAPLAPFGMRGAIWYQGESNAGRYNANLYGMQLALMISDWRARWGQGDFPFLYVQLPNFRRPQVEPVETTGWVIVQEEMLKTLKVPGAGMAVTIDIGEADDIHPRNKQDVGLRLAYWALSKVYGQDRVACGPLYRSMTSADGKVVVKFDHVGTGLGVRGEKLEGFAIAGTDRQFVWAEAAVAGPDTVVVSSPQVENPAAVRYAWAENPKGNLVNSADLPASPFRTDDWDLE